MKNSLADLHNLFFEQLERLNDDDLEGEKLKTEITRAKAITGVAREIILNGKLVLDARVALSERDIDEIPDMLAGGKVKQIGEQKKK